MKKNILYSLLSFIFILFNTNIELRAQTAACSGTISASALGAWGAGTQIGNGTAGNIQVCITANSLVAAGMGCTDAQLIVSTGNGTGIQVIWTQATPNTTCFTFASGTGFGWLSKNCFGVGSNATLTWQTVNGSGTNVCPTCTDGIQNGTETGIDCGGSCPPCSITPCTNGIMDGGETGIDCGGPCPNACGTCFDGIQNGTETGVDCGGPCMACTVNSGTVTSSCGACPTASSAVVYSLSCSQIGTSAYNLTSPSVNMVSCGTATTPVPSPTCATIGSQGTWVHVDLAPGVTQVQLAFNSGSVGSGSSNTYASAYQGAGCGSLTAVPGGCQNSVSFISGTYGVYQNFFYNLNPSQDLWIFMFNDGGKTFSLNYNLIGTAGAPSNTTCAASAPAAGSACNLGAPGATFPTPGSAGVACTGGNWGSNENTTFYSFTPTASTATLSVSNILCNGGGSGSAQFGVWTSCAAVGTYTSGSTFLGCVVGSSGLTMSGLTAGQTYYIAADGFAGDNCKWIFTGTNLLLPVELKSFNALQNGNVVDVVWITASQKVNDFFTVEKSVDGINFKEVEIVDGEGESGINKFYSITDRNPEFGVSYYRLKQTDFNGKFSYSNIVSVEFKSSNDLNFEIVPNPKEDYVSTNIVFSYIPESVVTVIILDINGVVLYEAQKKLNENKYEIPNDFAKGVYFVKIVSANNTSIKRMMIK